MKGIILAGGTGSRLYPLTKVINKHLLPIGKYPMIYHALFKLKQADIHDILIVSGKEHMGSIMNVIGSGVEWRLNITYKVQDGPGGIAQALKLAEGFIHGGLMTVILGDNIFSDPLQPYIDNYKVQAIGAKVLLKEVEDPKRFGVATIDGHKIVSIEEKPANPKSNYAVTGIYMFDSQVFDIINGLEPSSRGELEITDVNNAYIGRNQLTYDVLSGWWTDAGTHESLFLANELAKNIELS